MNIMFFESEVYNEFQKKHGKIFINAVDGNICYESIDGEKLYIFPNGYDFENIESVCKKSLSTNKDFVLEYLIKNGTNCSIKSFDDGGVY